MTTYTKPHLTYQEQVKLLQSRGLIVNDEDFAVSKLKHISYYRLSAYFLPFCKEKDLFDTGVTFEQIIDLYHFDKEIRILTFSAIEKIEIFLRTAIAYNFSKNYDAFGHLDNQNFCIKSIDDFDCLSRDISKETGRSKETFAKHFKEKYHSEKLPIWMSVEIISFGTLSRLYSLLCADVEKKILDGIDLPSFVFKNWLHVFSYVRNISAHHSRLWNRQFVIKAKIPKHKKAFSTLVNDKYITFAVMTHYVLSSINDTFDFKSELNKLFEKYPNTDFGQMGFRQNWQDMQAWSIK